MAGAVEPATARRHRHRAGSDQLKQLLFLERRQERPWVFRLERPFPARNEWSSVCRLHRDLPSCLNAWRCASAPTLRIRGCTR